MNQFYIKSIDKPASVILFKKDLHSWVILLHEKMLKEYNSKKFKIYPEEFGYDTYAAILYNVLTNISNQDIILSIQNQLDISKLIMIAHRSWCENYIYWKNLENKKVSSKHINNNDRNDRATRTEKNINEEDTQMYIDIINTVLDILKMQVLEAGINALNV